MGAINSTEDNKKTIKMGDIVAVTTHPYSGNSENFVIAAYNKMTPPYMVVSEVKKGGKYDKKTGERYHSYKCVFYSAESCKYEEYWFKDFELKKVVNLPEPHVPEHENLVKNVKDLRSGRKTLIGKRAILKTVELELSKKQIFKDTDPTKNKYREKQCLDFLPPLCTIINLESQSEHILYDEKTGKVDLEKSKFNVKLRWYNYKKSRYSEEFVPLNSLYLIDTECNVEEYSDEKIYFYKKELKLQENKEISLNKFPVKFHDIVFNHYFYIYRFRNLLTSEFIYVYDLNEIEKADKKKSNLLKLIQGGFRGFEEAALGNIIIDKDCEGKWYKILYSNRNQEVTTRIILVNKRIDMSTETNSNKVRYIEANCLLRNGDIRHFRIKRILAAEEVTGIIDDLFMR